MQVAGLQAAQGGTAGSRRGDDHSLQSLTELFGETVLSLTGRSLNA